MEICSTRVVCRWLSAYYEVDFVKHIHMWTQKAWLPSLDNITQSHNDSCQSNHQFGKVPSLSVSDFLSLGVANFIDLDYEQILTSVDLEPYLRRPSKAPKWETHLCWWFFDLPPCLTADPLVAYVFSFWIGRAVCDWKDFSTLLV